MDGTCIVKIYEAMWEVHPCVTIRATGAAEESGWRGGQKGGLAAMNLNSAIHSLILAKML